MKPQILIVGAGPTGLDLAYSLARLHVPFRIIEKKSGTGTASRALAVHARILEHYQQLGISERIVEQGQPILSLDLSDGKEVKANLKFQDFGKGLSPFPLILSLPQDEHEDILVDELKKLDIDVEWDTELSSFANTADGVRAVLKKEGHTEETADFVYMCGCDGASSTVRKELDFEFPGGTYKQLFFVADVETEEPEDELEKMDMYMDDDGFMLYMSVRDEKTKRILGVVPEDLSQIPEVEYHHIREYVETKIKVNASHVNWFSTYRVHYRVSEHFAKGNIFILGDAGHLHSPAGGQGMNTGIGDAFNLSWKLAAVLQGKAAPSLLDTYETERIAFARRLVSTTDRAFQTIINQHLRGTLLRKVAVPYILPAMFKLAFVKKTGFKILSQIHINYRDSALSKGKAGKVFAGMRLPWIYFADSDNFAPLQSVDWQIHVYGKASKELLDFANVHSLAVHEFAWGSQMDEAGFRQDALYLVRPDGHVAVANKKQDIGVLKNYLDEFQIVSFHAN